MSAEALRFATLDAAAAALRAGETTALALARAALDRIAETEPTLNAFITVTADAALAAAEAADADLAAGRDRGPLHGIPLGLKDLIETRDAPTTFASRAYADHRATRDAPVAARLRAAGAVILGKTNLSEGAADGTSLSSAFGAPRNPWNPAYVTGGSSGGSAAAVAAGQVFGALGSDTAMSIRQPAALCGIVGLKPSFGRVPKAGCLALSFSLDHIGPMTRGVADAAHLLQAIAGPAAEDPTAADAPVQDFSAALGRGAEGARIALDRAAFLASAAPDWAAETERAAAALEAMGARVEEVALADLEDLIQAALTLLAVEAAAFHAPRLRTAPELFGPGLAGLLRAGAAHSAVHYVQAQRFRRLAGERLLADLAPYDALLLPTTPLPACRVEEDDPTLVQRRMAHTMPFNAVGAPAISLPSGLDARGLPIGVQLVGRPFEEARLLGLAAALEAAEGFGLGPPPI